MDRQPSTADVVNIRTEPLALTLHHRLSEPGGPLDLGDPAASSSTTATTPAHTLSPEEWQALDHAFTTLSSNLLDRAAHTTDRDA